MAFSGRSITASLPVKCVHGGIHRRACFICASTITDECLFLQRAAQKFVKVLNCLRQFKFTPKKEYEEVAKFKAFVVGQKRSPMVGAK